MAEVQHAKHTQELSAACLSVYVFVCVCIQWLGTHSSGIASLVEEAQDFAACVLSSRLLVVHDTICCGEDNVAELLLWDKGQ